MQLRPLRIRDIAQATRIPRETVRRKLGKLQRAGRVLRTRAGWTYNPEGVDDELREFTKETIRRHLAATQVVVDALAGAR
jgi:DeoR/GlpR family transcriptional regulator of sugar metabolism